MRKLKPAPIRIREGDWFTRNGRIARVSFRADGLWFGFVTDDFGDTLPVQWNREGRLSLAYDSRWDLIRPAKWADGKRPSLTLAQVFDEEEKRKKQ